MEKIIKFIKSYAFWTLVFAFWGWFFANVDSCSEKHPVKHKATVSQNYNVNSDDITSQSQQTLEQADELSQIVNHQKDL